MKRMNLNNGPLATAAAISVAAVMAFACGTPTKLKTLQTGQFSADVKIADDYAWKPDAKDIVVEAPKDTFEVLDFDGRKVLLMNAVADENGEMVAHDVIQAAVVTARFRNIAERHGKVDLKFDVTVPKEMIDSKWQLRFYPQMTLLGETSNLEPIYITGRDYRKEQLRGYQLYQKYLDSIIRDTTVFINKHLLEAFIERNIPKLWAYRNSDEIVEPAQFYSDLGVSGKEAIDHYTNWIRVRANKRKIKNIPNAYKKYVKAPIDTDGLRLDTIITNADGGFTYAYVQTINTRPKLKKADITLAGDIYEGPQKIYQVPQSEPITFYISSLSAFLDPTERYMTKVISRRAEANSACWIDFETGKSDINLSLGHNATEVSRIKGNFRQILADEVFDVDSIAVISSCSPEGSMTANRELGRRRAESARKYFMDYAARIVDSLRRDRENQFFIDVSGTEGSYSESSRRGRYDAQRFSFRSRTKGEDWETLDRLVARDSVMTEGEKQVYRDMVSGYRDPDARERAMSAMGWYRHMREKLYPRLRTVEFKFDLHRKGMIKDTVHTTELDTEYMRGVQAIQDRDYEEAIKILRPYTPDYNLAVAYCAMDYNESAYQILKDLPETDRVAYMLALIHARRGDDRNAVQSYLRSVGLNPSYVYRGNLDPEISELIRKYGLNKQEEPDDLPY